MKKVIKQQMLQAASWGGLFFIARQLTRRRFRIFAYHGVSAAIDPRLNFDGFFVSPEVFEIHLQTLQAQYHVMPLADMVEQLAAGHALPPRAAAITFDDGYADNATVAAPLLAKYGLPATFFITTGFIDGTSTPWWFRVRRDVFGVRCSVFGLPDGSERRLLRPGHRAAVVAAWEQHLKNLSHADRETLLDTHFPVHPTALQEPDSAALVPPFLSWSQIRDLAAAGHDIGAHTVSHISLGHEANSVIEDEIRRSLDRIRSELGTVSPVYSYPYGEPAHFTDALGSMLKRHGCLAGVTTVEGMNAEGDDPFLWRRLNVTGNHDHNAFRALASGLTYLIKK